MSVIPTPVNYSFTKGDFVLDNETKVVFKENLEFQPRAIGGYSPVRTVYDFEPVPESLDSTEITISLFKNEKDYYIAKTINIQQEKNIDSVEIKKFSVNLNAEKVRYIKLKADNLSIIPDWHEAAGSNPWIFLDEIIVN